MSGITPILDTLLHQVLGRRVEVPLNQTLNEPVRPLHPGEALPALRSDSRLDPRPPSLTDLQQRGAYNAPAPSAPAQPPAPAMSTRTHFSVAAKAIAQVLSQFPAPPSAILPAAPLLNLTPVQGEPVTRLAQQLRASIEHSGLFYQAHLARWHRGELPLAALAREPQMQLTRPVLAQRLLQGEWTAPFQRTDAPPIVLSAPVEKKAVIDFAMLARRRGEVTHSAPPARETPPAPINDALQGLVRHQLEVLATPVLHWQGDVWTGLFMSLSLGWLPQSLPAEEADPEARQREHEAAQGYRWQLTLTLTHDQLGQLQGTLLLLNGELAIRLWCERETVADLFSANRDALCRRLEDAGFDAVHLQIKNAEREPAGDER